MNKVQRTVEIELTKEECRVLYEAEKLLKEMQREIELIATPTYLNDKQEIADCLDKFMTIACRYSIHVALGVENE